MLPGSPHPTQLHAHINFITLELKSQKDIAPTLIGQYPKAFSALGWREEVPGGKFVPRLVFVPTSTSVPTYFLRKPMGLCASLRIFYHGRIATGMPAPPHNGCILATRPTSLSMREEK
jgi:hypothetical protein